METETDRETEKETGVETETGEVVVFVSDSIFIRGVLLVR